MPARLRCQNNTRMLSRSQPVLIGRQVVNQQLASNLFPLDDPFVSSRHAIIRFDRFTGRYTITNLNGPNGPVTTYIHRSNPDGSHKSYEPVPYNHTSPLHPGDAIIVGHTEIFYEVVPNHPQQVRFPTQTGNPSQGSGGGGFVAFLILLILIGAGVYASQNNSASTPGKTLTAFCNAVESSDYQTAYNQLSTHSRSQGTEAQFASTLQQAISKQGGLKACLATDVKSSQTTATGMITYTFVDGKTASYLDSLITEKSVWKIDSTKTV